MGLDMYLYAQEYISGYDFTTALEPLANDPSELAGLADALRGVGLTAAEVTPEPAPPEHVVRYRQALDLSGLADMADPNTPSVYIQVTVAYWRKANAVHGWFVENVQDDRDECQRSYVRTEQLRELRNLAADVAERVRAGDESAAEDLPTRSGFFFGPTAIDEWYLGDLDDTVKQLDRVLNHPKVDEVDFYYQSSW